jgi:hypothetical protein
MWDVDVFVSIFYEEWLLEGCTLSAEKIFQCESSEFLFVSVALFLFLYGVSGSVLADLACA